MTQLSKETEAHKTHHLKIYPEHFSAVLTGVKRAELRKNDRDYKVGDTLHLMETPKGSCSPTGEFVNAVVTHIADVSDWLPGYVLLSIEREPLYAAPQVAQPVQVPDASYQMLSDMYHAQEKRLFKLAQRIKGPAFDKYAHSPSQAIDVLEAALFGEGTADSSAMLAAPQPTAEQQRAAKKALLDLLHSGTASISPEPDDTAPISATDQMAYAFHHALTDSPIGDDDVQDIKCGLQAVFDGLAAGHHGSTSDNTCQQYESLAKGGK